MELIQQYDYSFKDKLNNFEKFISRQSLARSLVRYELFKQIINVKGSIVECGVHYGGGIMNWAKLSSALEPYAIHRKIIGFDTFSGFPSMSENDLKSVDHTELKGSGFQSHEMIYEEIMQSVNEYDENRFLNQFNKVELVKGDANLTIPKYIDENQHLVVSLLFLDFDIYEPTKTALTHFLERMPKGSVIAFDEINNEFWKGETIAMMEEFVSLNNLELKKFEFDPNIAYAVIQ